MKWKHLRKLEREEATKDGDFTLNEDDEVEEEEEWEGDADWANDGDDVEEDVKDESAAYLEFLSEEVSRGRSQKASIAKSSNRPKSLVPSVTTMTMS